jgi:hypothetical protein
MISDELMKCHSQFYQGADRISVSRLIVCTALIRTLLYVSLWIYGDAIQRLDC